MLVVGDADDGLTASADRADGFVFADDDAATIRAVVARATAGSPMFQVRDLSDGTARTINALSAEASRIAEALPASPTGSALLMSPTSPSMPRSSAGSSRRAATGIVFSLAEIFADPAWDMLLDLIATQLEGKPVPVSSLCIAAAVPTTTALRRIRSLSEAGLFIRKTDPNDARRTWISLAPDAADAVLAWRRQFAGQFSARQVRCQYAGLGMPAWNFTFGKASNAAFAR